MRACFVALDEGCLPAFAKAAFEAYWGDLKDISQPDEIAAIASRVGLDPQALATAMQSDDVKARLRDNTEELIARGGFGSPTMFINETDMYFGNDRLTLVEAALMKAQAEA
jgi:2-hydroxychromene-2-carboxylate isomerase